MFSYLSSQRAGEPIAISDMISIFDIWGLEKQEYKFFIKLIVSLDRKILEKFNKKNERKNKPIRKPRSLG